jgi:hypothetical protein
MNVNCALGVEVAVCVAVPGSERASLPPLAPLAPLAALVPLSSLVPLGGFSEITSRLVSALSVP